MINEEIEDIEFRLLLEALRLRYGYDFQNYSAESLKRRLQHCLATCEFRHISDIIPKLLYEGAFLDRFISEMTVTTTEMFRDPSIYVTIQKRVFPVLATYPYINIWHAGCSTGEEVYSLAILLQEHKLHHRARIYATDINPRALARAKEGIYPVQRIKDYSANYLKAGGKGSLSDFYHAKYDLIRIDPKLKENIVFASHNLATDSVFAETQLILCRNVMIYFDRTLQDRVFNLFRESLAHGGFLCLGSQETLRFAEVFMDFENVSEQDKLYRKRIIREMSVG